MRTLDSLYCIVQRLLSLLTTWKSSIPSDVFSAVVVVEKDYLFLIWSKNSQCCYLISVHRCLIKPLLTYQVEKEGRGLVQYCTTGITASQSCRFLWFCFLQETKKSLSFENFFFFFLVLHRQKVNNNLWLDEVIIWLSVISSVLCCKSRPFLHSCIYDTRNESFSIEIAFGGCVICRQTAVSDNESGGVIAILGN